MNDINIRYLKLISGEELYTEVIDASDNTLVIQQPLVIKMMFDSEHGVHMTIQDWILGTSSKVYTINKTHIMVNANLNNKLKEQYLDYVNGVETSLSPESIVMDGPTSIN